MSLYAGSHTPPAIAIYAPTELHQGTFIWSLLVAGLAQGAIFFALLIFQVFSAPARSVMLPIALARLGAGVAWLGANVVFNFSALALCNGSSLPLRFSPSVLQTLFGACCRVCVAARLRRVERRDLPMNSEV